MAELSLGSIPHDFQVFNKMPQHQIQYKSVLLSQLVVSRQAERWLDVHDTCKGILLGNVVTPCCEASRHVTDV
jgi:hypothetical protein